MGVAAGPIRVVVAKPGLDGHDRGAKVIARALRDAGMEVIYTGLHQTPEQIVGTAIQEDADAIGLSILSGAHNTLFARVIELLKERDAADIKVFGGGIIPEADIAPLKEKGVAEIFTPGATTASIVEWVRANVRPAGGLPAAEQALAGLASSRRAARGGVDRILSGGVASAPPVARGRSGVRRGPGFRGAHAPRIAARSRSV